MPALRILDKIVEAAAVAAFAVSSLFILVNVLNRYLILGFLRDWSRSEEAIVPVYRFFREAFGSISVTADEVPGLLLVWVAFLGAYLAMRREGHIAFDLLLTALPRRLRIGFLVVNAGLMIGFLGIVLWHAVRMIRISGATEIETAEIAQGWFMAIVPIGAVLLLIAVVDRLNREIRALEPTEDAGGSSPRDMR